MLPVTNMSKLETGPEPDHGEFRAGAGSRTGFLVQQFNGGETWSSTLIYLNISEQRNEEWWSNIKLLFNSKVICMVLV